MNLILYNDDCFNVFDKIKENSIDMICVDLPYGVTSCKWDSQIDLEKMWDELKKICKKKCIYVFFATTKFGYELIHSNKKWFRYDLVWEKSRKVGFFNSKLMPMRNHEMVYVFSNPDCKVKEKTYNAQKIPGKPYIRQLKERKPSIYGDSYTRRLPIINKGERHPASIIKFNNVNKPLHKTQKPTDLLEWLIKSYSNKNDTILDFTMGSGSTGEACKNTNRKFIGIEKNKEIFKIAENRLNETIDLDLNKLTIK